ncbi:peptide ABC transporter ATP-binding protein [Candidatus Magnetomorum sp. HK-1]|nr:peptide ABC transporter ATP-binding protein [Candidatus Magnetomorum sp. HK-1]
MLLEVKNLSTHFFSPGGNIKAVDNISFCLDKGETLALVGESGSGKTVTALSLLRLISNPPGKIMSGEILFEGRDLLQLTSKEMRQVRGNRIAIIFQEPMTSLNPVLTVGYQIMEPLMLHKKMRQTEALKKCWQLLEKVQISDPKIRSKFFPHMLSGGMKQRIMIAMGMSCNPSLIIADEPTTALDVTIQAQLLELLKDLTREMGSSMILITHDLGLVARYADKVNVMYAGHIVEKAYVKDLYANPCHPYTQALLKSIPRIDQDLRKKLTPVQGNPPDLFCLPKGCAFHPRCNQKIDICMKLSPELKLLANNHESACWIYE